QIHRAAPANRNRGGARGIYLNAPGGSTTNGDGVASIFLKGTAHRGMQNQNRHGRIYAQNGRRGGRDNLRGRRSSYKQVQSVGQSARDFYADKSDGVVRRQSDSTPRSRKVHGHNIIRTAAKSVRKSISAGCQSAIRTRAIERYGSRRSKGVIIRRRVSL